MPFSDSRTFSDVLAFSVPAEEQLVFVSLMLFTSHVLLLKSSRSTVLVVRSGEEATEHVALLLSVLPPSDFLRTSTCGLHVLEPSALAMAAPRPCWPNFCSRQPAGPPAVKEGLLNQERDDICCLLLCFLSSYAGK